MRVMRYLASYRARVVRNAAVPLLAVGMLLTLAVVSTTNATAGTGPLTILGYVYDNMGNPLEGASVVVTNEDTSATFSTSTDESGYYQDDFESNQWYVGDRVRVDVTYMSAEATNYTDITEDHSADSFAQVDVHYLTEIPEFGSFVGVVVASIAIGTVALFSMRKRKA